MIPTLEDLYARCIEDGSCLLWQGACTGGGQPSITLPGMKSSRGVRAMAWRLQHDRDAVPARRFIFPACGQRTCIAPGCLRCGTKSDYMRNAARYGSYVASPRKVMATEAFARARSKLDWDAVRAIRAERAEGRALREIAEARGLTIDNVWSICTHRSWRDVPKGFSVFSQRFAA